MALTDAIRARIPDALRRRWPSIRAALVAFHVAAVVVLSLPSPGGVMQRSSWDDPTVQNEFRIWSDRLRGVGVDVSPVRLDRWLWDVAQRWLSVREGITAPFQPYTTYAGTRQSWRMFSAPQRYPVRLEISVREPSGWRKVYETRSQELAWERDTFDAYRMRRVVFMTGWDKERRNFETLCDWIARRAARDFPEATEVMVRQQKYRTPVPAEARAGQRVLEPKYIGHEVRDLRRLR